MKKAIANLSFSDLKVRYFTGRSILISDTGQGKWYADEEEAKLWRPLLDKIIFEKETTNMSTNTTNPFYGKTVVATGKLENYTRDGIQMRLLELGAKPGSSVSKNTDYLIVGEKAGSKLAKAQQLGVKTLTEQEFENMLAE